MSRILVVEDDPAIRVLLERILTSHGYSVQTAPNARDAMAFVLYDLPHVPDIAILDVVLPGISGVACADHLLRHFPSIRLIFMTGWQEALPQHEEARRRGPVLAKPFAMQSLLDAIRSVGYG